MQPSKTYHSNDSSDSLDALVFTLDPKDKYLPPGVRRARTTSAIQQRKNLSPGLSRMNLAPVMTDGLEPETRGSTPLSTREGPSLKPQRSLVSIFDRLRRTKSADSSSPRAATSWHRRVLSRAGSQGGSRARSSKRAISPEDVPAVPQVPAHILAASDSSSATSILTDPAKTTTHTVVDHPSPFVHAMAHLALSATSEQQIRNKARDDPGAQREAGLLEVPGTSLGGKFGAPSKSRSGTSYVHEREPKSSQQSRLDSHRPHPPESKTELEAAIPSSMFAADFTTLRNPLAQDQILEVSNGLSTFSHEDMGPTEYDDHTPGHSCANSSYATDENFSPNLASKSTQSGPTSPIQLSQPETPIMSDFGDDAISWRRGSDALDVDVAYLRPPSRAPPPPPPPHQQPAFSNPFMINTSRSGFQNYCLPHDDHASTHTVRKSSSVIPGHPEYPLHHQTDSQDLVHSWNDGSEHQMTALEELVDDLGYLGAFIE